MRRRTFCDWSSLLGVIHTRAISRHHSKSLNATLPSLRQEPVLRPSYVEFSREEQAAARFHSMRMHLRATG